MRKFILLSLTVFTAFTASAQDFSNKGKDFWVAYGYHTSMQPANGNSQDMVLYFATDQVTTITITIPATGYTQTLVSGAAPTVLTSSPIPKNGAGDARLLNVDGLSDKGIHITSDKPMVAYAHIYNGNCSGATILYPTNTLGKEYYSVNYKNWSNQNQANCWFYVMAVDTGTTTVEITPQAVNAAGVITTGGWVAGTTYTVTLTQGQIYNVVGNLTGGGPPPNNNPFTGVDLTGSRVKSVSTGNGCKRIAMFSGSGRISITCNANSSSSDNYMVQAMPKTAWGKKYLTAQAGGNQAFNIYRVCVSNPAAVVKINGVVTGLPLQSGFFYEIPATNQPQKIEADSSIMVAQYFTSQGACGNGASPGDPEVIYLSAVEQNINTVQWNATPNFNILNTSHWLNVVVPNGGTGVSSFTLDGVSFPGAFVPHPQDAAYSYMRVNVSAGTHIIKSDSGFNAIAYGFGNAESYGYNAGTNIKDLYQQILVQTQYGIEQSPSVCTDAPFRFKISLPYCADSVHWNLSGLPGPPPAPPTQIFTTCTPGPGGPDSTTVVNGKTIYWYSLPTLYSFSTTGSFPVTITAYNSANPDGCGNAQDIDFTLQVSTPPVADFSWIKGGCVAEPFRFTETTPQTPKPTYSFWWNFGDPGSGAGNNTSNLRNPSHIFSAPGTYTVRYAAITTPGCLTDTVSHTVIVDSLPRGTISGTTTVCINSAPDPIITFNGINGTAPYTFTYTIDAGAGPGAPISINSPGSTSTVSINAPTTVAGIFKYELINVKDTGSALCTQNITGQIATITVQPDATIVISPASPGAANQTVCVNTAIADIVYDLGGSATGAVPDVTNVFPPGVTGSYNAATKKYTITGTPTLAGVYVYKINSVGPCLTPSVTGTITVTGDGVIAISPASPGTADQTVCVNTPITQIIFQAAGTTTNAVVTGLPPGVTGVYNAATKQLSITGSPNPVITVSTAYPYTITTSGPCVNPTASGTITVTPDATISLAAGSGAASQTVCVNNAIADIVYDLAGSATNAVPDVTSVFPPGVTGSYNAATKKYTITGTPTLAGAYIYRINSVGPCQTPFVTGTITVTADGAIAISPASPGTADQTVCVNTPITQIIFQAAGSTTNAVVAGLPPGVTGVYNAATKQLSITGTPNPVITVSTAYPYTITTSGPCVNPPASGTITVTPDATISLAAGSGAASQTVCVNNAIANIVYDLAGSATNAVPDVTSVFPPGVSGSYNAATKKYTITGTPTLAGVYIYRINSVGPCQTPFVTGTITVTGDGVIALSATSPGAASQSVCLNTPITQIIFQAAGTTTNAVVAGLPPGVTGVYNAATKQLSITGTPNPAITVTTAYPYTVTTSGPCVNPPASGTITVYALPTPNFSFTIPSCQTRVINFTDLSVANSGAISTWTWNFGDGSPTNNQQNPSHVYPATGTYNVTLSVSTSFGCTNAAPVTIPVTINDRPQAGFMIPEVCINDIAAVFTDTSKIVTGTITAWEWDFGDGSPRTFTQNGTHLYLATGVYPVMHIVTSALGCKDTLVQNITINGANPVANFTVANSATLCANDSVAITNLSTVNFGNVTRLEIYWDNVNFPAVFVFDDNPAVGKVYKHLYPNFQAPLTKPFTIRMRAFSGTLCYNDFSVNITVNAAPKVQFNNMPDTCFLAAPFQITQASEVGGVPGTGVFTGPGVTPGGIFSPAVAGIGLHTIKYTFTSTAAGCVDTMSKTIRVLDTAHAAFTNITPVCEGTGASFTDVSTAPAGVVLNNTVWDFGDGTPLENHAPGSTFTHVFANPGTFTVRMYNISTAGCNSTVFIKTVTVDPNHTISLTSGNNIQTVCINKLVAPITYDLGGGATGVTITGLPPGMSFAVVGTTLSITGAPNTTAGSPFIYNIQTTGNTCTKAQAQGQITVQPDHTLTIDPGSLNVQSVCVNTAILPIVYTLGGGANNVTVTGLPAGINYVLAGNVLTIQGTPTASTAGPQNFTIQTLGNVCNVASQAGSIRVNPYPVPAFTVDKPSYCIPNAVVGFINGSTMPDGSGMTYVWDFNDGSPLNFAVNPSHWYISQGPFNVTLTVRSTTPLTPSGVGCEKSIMIPVTNIHPQPRADFSLDKPEVCIGDALTVTDLSDGKDGVINQWVWNMGDGSIYNTNTVTHTYTDTITFAIKLYTVNSIGCNSDTITKLFTVHPYPHVDAGPDRVILEGGQITLESVTYALDPQYLWTPNLYLINNKVARPKVNRPLTDMTYTLTVTGRGGCAASDNVFVKLLKFPVIPNTFTPNNDGINDTWRIDYLNTYPDNRVQVFTRSGQLVFESRGYNTPWDGTIKGKPLPFDTYYYIIEPGNGRDPITGYVTIIK